MRPLKKTDNELLKCTGEEQKSVQTIKYLLAITPALRIPDLEKTFSLYVAKEFNSPGCPQSKLGEIPRPETCLSKQHQWMAGLPPCGSSHGHPS